MIKHKLVKNCMSHKVVTINNKTRLLEAMLLLMEHEIRRLPVVNDDKLIGIVTYGDFRDARPSSLKMAEKWANDFFDMGMPVERIMSRDPVAVRPDDTIEQVARLMREHKISGVPVVDDQKKVVGIITESDLFDLIIDEW